MIQYKINNSGKICKQIFQVCNDWQIKQYQLMSQCIYYRFMLFISVTAA